MKGLVVHAKKAGRLTLVATRCVKSQAYRLSLGLCGDALGEVLQREVRLT